MAMASTINKTAICFIILPSCNISSHVRKRDWLLGVNVFVQKGRERESRKHKAERKVKIEWSY
jgi:hypothetical protein